jgi:hypothetical protein
MVPSSITAAATSLATSHEVKPGRNHTWFDITTTFGRFANLHFHTVTGVGADGTLCTRVMSDCKAESTARVHVEIPVTGPSVTAE